jgi:hypothetical protein
MAASPRYGDDDSRQILDGEIARVAAGGVRMGRLGFVQWTRRDMAALK